METRFGTVDTYAGHSATGRRWLDPFDPMPHSYHHLVMGPALLSATELDRAFGALSDPTRRAILARLATGDAGVLEIAEPFPITQPAITKHLKVLEGAGLISRHRDARRLMCRLEPQRLKDISEWVGSYRQSLEDSFDRLDSHLDNVQRQEGQQ